MSADDLRVWFSTLRTLDRAALQQLIDATDRVLRASRVDLQEDADARGK